jgi:membrane associated rhomboid family serine protease
LIIPWKVDVPQDRRPFINWLIIAGAITAFVFQAKSVVEQSIKLQEKREEFKNSSVEDLAKELGVKEKQLKEIEQSVDKTADKIRKAVPDEKALQRYREKKIRDLIEEYFVLRKIRPFILSGWTIKGLLGHMWLHGGLVHLFGNMLFLWIFGNAVCAKIGNIRYLPIYLGLGVIAGISHLVFTGGNALGASGAIYGIVGMYLVFFPENEITCYLVIPFLFVKEICVSSIWMIFFWVAFDVWGAMKGGGGVAYFAHLGGFAAGFGLAILMLKFKLVVMEEGYEKSLLQLLSEKKRPAAYESAPLYIRHSGLSEKDLETVKPETAEPVELKIIPLESAFGPASPTARAEAGETSPAATRRGGPEPPKEEFIRFTCSCGKKLKMPTKYAGKTGICPKCKLRIKIPVK